MLLLMYVAEKTIPRRRHAPSRVDLSPQTITMYSIVSTAVDPLLTITFLQPPKGSRVMPEEEQVQELRKVTGVLKEIRILLIIIVVLSLGGLIF